MATTKKYNICLNMIVRDESDVIIRCIESTLPLITSWCIVDTGSVDDTMEKITNYFATQHPEIPGKLFRDKWVDFSHNRNRAMTMAKTRIEPKPDFLLFIDADETLQFHPNFDYNNISMDVTSYYFPCHFASVIYRRKSLVRADLDWYYFGVVHEACTCPKDEVRKDLPGVQQRPTNQGARSKDPNKYKKDANTIERDAIDNPTPRNFFYIAMCYKDDGDCENAMKWFKKRVQLGGSQEEMFISYMFLGRFSHVNPQEKDPEQRFFAAVKWFNKALELWPDRAEPRYELAKAYRLQNYWRTAYEYARFAEQMTLPGEMLYVDKSIYAFRLWDERAVTLCAVDKDYKRAAEIYEKVLADPYTQETIDAGTKSRIETNLQQIKKKISEETPAPSKPVATIQVEDVSEKIEEQSSQLPAAVEEIPA